LVEINAVVLAVMLSSHHTGMYRTCHKAHGVKTRHIHKIRSTWCITTLSEVDLATATGNMYCTQSFVKLGDVVSEISTWIDRQTDMLRGAK